MRFTVEIPGRVHSLNAERSAHWSKRHAMTKVYREAVAWQAGRYRGIRTPVAVTAEVVMRPPLMDAANYYPCVKAAVDGLIDAGVIPDDSPKHVDRVTMVAPRKPIGGEVERLVLIVEESPCVEP